MKHTNILRLIICVVSLFMLTAILIGCSAVVKGNTENNQTSSSGNAVLNPDLYKGNDNESVITQDIEELPKTPVDVTVSMAISYTKEMYHEFNSNYQQVIEIPKISGDSAEVDKFNQKILKKHGDTVDICKNGEDYGMMYFTKYWYKVYNGVVGIIILDERSTIGSFFNSMYYGYYFDANNDKELSYAEYLTLLQISEKDMVRNINRDSTLLSPDNSKIKFAAKSISATIYDGAGAKAVVPDYFGAQCMLDFEYEVVADVFEKAKPNPALEAELALVKYVDENSSEFYKNEYYEPHSLFLADINNDRIPELCVEYWSTAYDSRDGYIEAIKYENGKFIKIPSVASTGRRGPGILSGYALYYNDSGKLYFKEETEECNVFFGAQDYKYNVCIYSFDDSANREIAIKYTSAIIDGEYYYDDDGTSATKVTEEYYLSKTKECDNFIKSLSDIGIPKSDNLAINITDIWELQKSFYL